MTLHAPSRRRWARALAALAFAAASTGALAAGPLPPVEGIVTDVHDGDSFVLHAGDGRRLRVRVAGIDAPERGQPFGDAARRALQQALAVPRVRIEPVKLDRFGRTVARVSVPSRDDEAARDVGLAMVRDGLAWHFARYAEDQPIDDVAAYAAAQRDARDRRAGLWHARDPEAPWDFRRRMRDPDERPAAPGRSTPPARAG